MQGSLPELVLVTYQGDGKQFHHRLAINAATVDTATAIPIPVTANDMLDCNIGGDDESNEEEDENDDNGSLTSTGYEAAMSSVRLRQSCDRCRKLKLSCPKSESSLARHGVSSGDCVRCREARAACTYSASLHRGRCRRRRDLEVSKVKESLNINDSQATWRFYAQCFECIQGQPGRIIVSSFIKAIAPKKRGCHPYSKGNSATPDWWPKSLGKGEKDEEDNVRHVTPDRQSKSERIRLLTHILKMVVDPQTQHPEVQRPGVNGLQSATMKSLGPFFKNGKNEEMKHILEDLFDVARKEEKCKRKERDGTVPGPVTANDRVDCYVGRDGKGNEEEDENDGTDSVTSTGVLVPSAFLTQTPSLPHGASGMPPSNLLLSLYADPNNPSHANPWSPFVGPIELGFFSSTMQQSPWGTQSPLQQTAGLYPTAATHLHWHQQQELGAELYLEQDSYPYMMGLNRARCWAGPDVAIPTQELHVNMRTQPTYLPLDDCFASPNPTPERGNPYAAADQLFPQTRIEVFFGTQYPGPIDTTATLVPTIEEDPMLWATARVLQLGPQSPIAHQDSSLSEPIGCTQQHSLLCASKRASSSELPDGQLLEHERKRAARRAVEKKHREKEREDHKNTEARSKELEGLYVDLLAKKRALTEEKLDLIEQLFKHAAYCNKSDIGEYLFYASRQFVETTKEQHFLNAQGRRAASAPV